MELSAHDGPSRAAHAEEGRTAGEPAELSAGCVPMAEGLPDRRDNGRLPTGTWAAVDAGGFIRPARAAGTRTRAPGSALAPEAGQLLYSLVRSMRAACVVAFDGTADGSLDQLAAGARDNGTGRVVGHVSDARRAAAAHARLAGAGLAPWAEIRHAGPHELGRVPALVDLALLDCRPDLTLPALTALEGRMRPGTIVVALGSAPAGPYLDRVRDGEDYFSLPLSVGRGLEVSVRLTTAPSGAATPVRRSGGE